MNDFLQSIRNGNYSKDNRPRYNQQKQRRSYDNTNGNYRGNGNEKKYRSHKDHAPSDETLKGILEALEVISKNQSCAIKIAERHADAEERKATAFEFIASKFGEFNSASGGISDKPETETIPSAKIVPQITKPEKNTESQTTLKSYEIIKNDENDINKDEVMAMILSMRNDGSTYNEIANHLSKLNLPTFSGRGKWHAQTIHRLCQNI